MEANETKTREALKHCEAYLPDTDIKKFVIEALKEHEDRQSNWRRVYSHAFGKMVYECAKCGCEKIVPTDFCSECGRKMNGCED